jgi:hypothetical protein
MEGALREVYDGFTLDFMVVQEQGQNENCYSSNFGGLRNPVPNYSTKQIQKK